MIGGDARKPLTAAKVRAVLRKAGHTKGEYTTTRVKGWHDLHAGYFVTDGTRWGGVIDVEYRDRWDRDDKRQAAELAAYAETLKAAGIEAELSEGKRLICRGYLSPPVSEESSR